MTPKAKVYAKFMFALILWIAVYSLTRANTIFKTTNVALSDNELWAIYLFINIWALISFSYITKLNNIYKGLFKNPKTIYLFMDTLFVLMLLQDILYINLSFLNMASQHINDPFYIIKTLNFIILACYFYKMYRKMPILKQTIFKIFVATVFLLLSSNIELIIIDVLLLLYWICNRFLNVGSILYKTIDILVIGLLLITMVLSKMEGSIIFITNYIAIAIYGFYRMISKKRIDTPVPDKKYLN